MATMTQNQVEQFDADKYFVSIVEGTNGLAMIMRNAWMFFDDKNNATEADKAYDLYVKLLNMQSVAFDRDIVSYATKLQSIPMRPINRPTS